MHLHGGMNQHVGTQMEEWETGVVNPLGVPSDDWEFEKLAHPFAFSARRLLASNFTEKNKV